MAEQNLTFYGYQMEHLAMIAWALREAGIEPRDVAEFIEDYEMIYKTATEDAFRQIERSLQEALKPGWKGEEDEAD